MSRYPSSNFHQNFLLGTPIVGVAALVASAASAGLLYNPVVTQVGDGIIPLTTTGATTTIQVYANSVANQAAPLGQMAYGNGVLVNSGITLSEGELANNPGLADAATSGSGYAGTAYVFSAGYAANDGTAAVSSNAANANRVVGDMQVSGGFVGVPSIGASQTQATSYANTGNIRAAVGDDSASNFWAAGTSSKVATAGYSYFNSNTALQNAAGPTNTRTIQIRQGQLYGSSSTGSFVGISLIGSGTPTTSGQTVTPLFTTGLSTVASPEAFALIDDTNNANTPTIGGVNVPFNVAYVADAGSFSANQTPGIQKWVYSPTTAGNNGWSLDYTISDSIANDGYNGLAAELILNPSTGFTAAPSYSVVLFSTNTAFTPNGGNSLEQFTDPLEGVSAAVADGSLITLANSPVDDLFRGVALSPVVPEPASVALMFMSTTGLLVRRRRR